MAGTALAPGDIWRATMNGTLITGSPAVTRHFHIGLTYSILTVTGTPPTDLDLVTHVDANYSTALKNTMGSDATYDQSISRRLVPALNRPVHQLAAAGAGAGAVAAPQMAPQTAGILGVYTNLMGKSNRGRIYFPFPATGSNVTAGIPSVAYIGLLNAFGALMLADGVINGAGGGTATCQLVVYHRKTTLFTPITSTQARTSWGTLRRRSVFKPPRRRKSSGS